MVTVNMMPLCDGRKYGKVGRVFFDSIMTDSLCALIESADTLQMFSACAQVLTQSRRKTHKYGPYITPAPFSAKAS